MHIQEIIAKKRDGGILTKSEIDFFIEGFTNESIPDYQAAALIMAMYINKLTKEEAFLMTDAMKASGDIIDLSSIVGIKVDKHSTGGVGDKTTLAVGPLAAACGVPVAKMSGRGLGFTGGTVDKMESIPGFCTEIEPEEFVKIVNKIGLAIVGQSGHLAPADKKIYALRDVTATVANIGLITSSVMSKKLAAGADAIVLDVKCGAGAFMATEEEAAELGEWLVEIGKSAGKDTVALVTEMGQPLGRAVGNANEVIEAIDTLKGKGPEDITELSLRLSAYMVYLAKKANSPEEGYIQVKEKLENGEALEKMRRFIDTQGGNAAVIDDYSLFPAAEHQIELISEKSGYVCSINAEIVGMASQLSGAGREKKGDKLDLSAGIFINKKVGEKVEKGQPLAVIHGNDMQKLSQAMETLKGGFAVGDISPGVPKLIKRIIQ